MSQTQMNLFTALRSAASVNIDRLTTKDIEQTLENFRESNFDLDDVLELITCIASLTELRRSKP